MAENPDYILELSGSADASAEPAAQETEGEGSGSRKWIGVRFQCCGVYTRIWRNREGTAYVGHCPRCHRKVQARIGPGGVSSRFFEAC